MPRVNNNRDISQFHRQLDVFPVEKLQNTHVSLIGAGSLGSFSALMLVKMGVENLQVFDDDVVETHNLPVQLYRQRDLNLPKVNALRNMIRDFEGVRVNACYRRMGEDKEALTEVVVSAVDSMASRDAIWKHIRLNPQVKLYIDTRAGAKVAELYAIDPCNMDDIKRYEKELFPDSEGYQAPCTEKMSTFIAGAVGSYVASSVASYVTGNKLPFKRILDLYNSMIIMDE